MIEEILRENEGERNNIYMNRKNSNANVANAIVEPLNFMNNSTNKNKINKINKINNSLHMKESFSKNNKLINKINKHKINNQSKANNYIREFIAK